MLVTATPSNVPRISSRYINPRSARRTDVGGEHAGVGRQLTSLVGRGWHRHERSTTGRHRRAIECQVGSGFGRTLLVVGPESLLAERAVEAAIRRVRAEDPLTEVASLEAGRLDLGTFTEITGASLFSSRRAAVITDLGELPAELIEPVAALAAEPADDLALVLVHRGGQPGQGAAGPAAASRRPRRSNAPPLKPWELPQFVQAEAKRAGGAIEQDAARLLVEAVGHDLRALAAGVAQLLADAEQQQS